VGGGTKKRTEIVKKRGGWCKQLKRKRGEMCEKRESKRADKTRKNTGSGYFRGINKKKKQRKMGSNHKVPMKIKDRALGFLK